MTSVRAFSQRSARLLLVARLAVCRASHFQGSCKNLPARRTWHQARNSLPQRPPRTAHDHRPVLLSCRALSIKVLTYELSEVRAELEMRYKARFWRVRRVAEEDERDEILGHTRRYITLFAIFTPLVIIMLVLSPITREETSNEESIQSHFPAQSH